VYDTDAFLMSVREAFFSMPRTA